jgi:Ca2+-binding RTX toxin-like protein
VRFVALAVFVLALGTQLALAGGGPPRRTFVGTDGPDTLLGTPAPDLIRGLGGEDELYAGGGSDEVDGGSGEDHIYGGNGHDALRGSSRGDSADVDDYRRERLVGGAGRDVLSSGMAGAVLIGGTGSDQLHALRRPGCRVDLNARRRLSDGPRCVIWLIGGPGTDRFWAKNLAADVVVCGRADIVVGADRIDRVSC